MAKHRKHTGIIGDHARKFRREWLEKERQHQAEMQKAKEKSELFTRYAAKIEIGLLVVGCVITVVLLVDAATAFTSTMITY